MVKFISDTNMGRVPTAIVRADGTFSASFYGNEDGAPGGKFRLFVIWMQTPPEGGLARDRLGGQFLKPENPVATITVTQGVNHLEPIALQTTE
ncbi:MAG: hypothetical protein RIC12_01755 [Pirellulales bacterium]